MALKFNTPEAKQQRLKILIYGEAGSGKSTFCCMFPNVAYFDAEDTTSKKSYAEAIRDGGGGVIHTGDIDEVTSQVKELMSVKHEFKTVVIDSLTVIYENLLLETEKQVGSNYGRHKAAADKKMKQLINLLLRLDMNCIITCQARKEYSSNSMEVIGKTFAGYERLGYMVDLMLETSVLGHNFDARVRKSRLNAFVTGDSVKFNYEEIMKRCGEIIEKPVKIEKLATPEQVTELKRLIALLKVPEATTDKWLSKSNSSNFGDMSSDVIGKCIDNLNKQINGSE